jgi:hypothetical protein
MLSSLRPSFHPLEYLASQRLDLHLLSEVLRTTYSPPGFAIVGNVFSRISPVRSTDYV